MDQKKKKSGVYIDKIVLISALVLVFVAGLVVADRGQSWKQQFYKLVGNEQKAEELSWSSLNQFYTILNKRFDGQIDQNKLLDFAYKGIAASTGDPHTTFLTADESKELTGELSGDFGAGIGAELGMRNGYVEVMKALDNNPAKQAGVMNGDVIVEVNDEDVTGQELETVVKKVRGEVGSKVKIGILREDSAEKKYFTITRAKIDNPSVTVEYRDNIAVIELARFDEGVDTLMSKVAREVVAKKAKGIVLDLRGNTGGYLAKVGPVAGLWVSDQPVVIEKRKGEVVSTTNSSANNDILKNIPTTILINSGTASASEILAGSLKHYKKATLIGEQTYGKGSVQEMVPFGQGILKVTVEHWYLPGGETIEKNGIKPDQKVELNLDDYKNKRDPQLDAAVKFIQARK